MAELSPARKRTLELQARVFKLAATVLSACPQDIPDIASREVWRQLVKASLSASNNLEEADEASSTADFIAKMKIALREAKEARRCLQFITRCELRNWKQVASLDDEAYQISAIFAKIVINTKRRIDSA